MKVAKTWTTSHIIVFFLREMKAKCRTLFRERTKEKIQHFKSLGFNHGYINI